MGKQITQIQIVWFFSNPFNGNFEDFSLKLKNRLGDSKTTQQLPIPADAPNEIPRLILNYSRFNLQVSKNRIDLFLKDVKSNDAIISNINDVLIDDIKLSIGRIGFVKNFFIDKKLEDLKKLLVTEKIGTLSLKEISIRINEIRKIENYDCNNIESLSTGLIIKKNPDGSTEKENGVVVTRDINTLAEKLAENNFVKTDITKLIGAFDTKSELLTLI